MICPRYKEKTYRLKENLRELRSQIDLAVSLMEALHSHGRSIVSELEELSSVKDYLKQFSKVNGCLSRHISVVMDVNCNLEIEICKIQGGDDFDKLLRIENPRIKAIESSSSKMSEKPKKYEDVGLKYNERITRNLPPFVSNSSILDIKISSDSEYDIQPIQVDSNVKIKNDEEFEATCIVPLKILNNPLSDNACSQTFCLVQSPNTSEEAAHSRRTSTVTRVTEMPSVPSVKMEKPTPVHAPFDEIVNVDRRKDAPPASKQNPALGNSLQSPEVVFIKEKRNTAEKNHYLSTLDSNNVSESLGLPKRKSLAFVTTQQETQPSHGTSNFDLVQIDVSKSNTVKTDFNKTDTSNSVLDLKPVKVSRVSGTSYNAIVEHVVTPGEIYVQFLTDEISQLEEMEKELKEYCSKSQAEKLNYRSTKNDFYERKCMAITALGEYAVFNSIQDTKFHRVKITDWRLTSEDDMVLVQFIDYGDSDNVSLDQLQPLVNRFGKYPIFAQKCYLSNVYPVDCQPEREMKPWQPAAKNLLTALLEGASQFKVSIGQIVDCYPSDSIPIWIFSAENNSTVNQLLVNYEQAIFLNNPPLPSLNKRIQTSGVEKQPQRNCTNESEDLAEFDPMREDYEACTNNYGLNVDDPAAEIYGYVSKDYQTVCHEFSRTGKCFKGLSCRKEHKHLNPSGFTTDKEPIYVEAFNKLKLPARNEVIEVLATVVKQVDSFCCFACNERHEQETLTTLNEHINRPDNIREMEKLSIPPSVGQIVLGKYKDDDMWYRARVIDVCPELNTCRLLFVDFGNEQPQSFSNIRLMKPQYLHLPFQAMYCQLKGVKLNPHVDAEEAIKYFYELINNGEVMRIKVVSVVSETTMCLIVELFDDNWVNIGHKLIKSGYALPKEDVLFSPDCDFVPG